MVFEQFLESDTIKKHALYIFVLGMFYVFVGYFVSSYFFQADVSVAMLFSATLLLTPSIYTILNIEEKIERTQGTRHFFKDHKDIFKIYLFLFLGIFFAFVLLSSFSSASIFDYQMSFLENKGDIAAEVQEYVPTVGDALGKISNNLLVIVIAFVLSLFYGAGALFLIVLNASIFAAFITYTIKSLSALSVGVFFLIHLVPELSGFLIAAIAGGVLSRAIMREKFGSQGFKNVAQDAIVMLIIAAGLIVIAAFLEVFVSATLVKVVV